MKFFFGLLLIITLLPDCLALGRTGILLAAFGTSVREAQSSYVNIEKAYSKKFPDATIAFAFTSGKIRAKLAKSGDRVFSPVEALDELAKKGCKTIYVQSLHITAGEEFARLARSILRFTESKPDAFEAVYLCRPLLETRADADKTAQALLAWLKSERKPEEAIVLMAHGQKNGRGDLILEGMRATLAKKDQRIFMGSVENEGDFDTLLADLKKAGIKKARLVPLMVVSGDHARNDLAGKDADSWASRLEADGIQAIPVLKGLGELPEVAEIFVSHTVPEDDLLKIRQ